MNLRNKIHQDIFKSLLWDNVRRDLWYSVTDAIENPVISFVSKNLPDRVVSDVGLSVCVPTNEKLRQYEIKPKGKTRS